MLQLRGVIIQIDTLVINCLNLNAWIGSVSASFVCVSQCGIDYENE